MRIYARGIGSYEEILTEFPENMKKDIRKGGDCKKLNSLNCSPTCPGGYLFSMDGEEYRKCKNSAFFHDLSAENEEFLMKLIFAELETDLENL